MWIVDCGPPIVDMLDAGELRSLLEKLPLVDKV